ncbi:uncharacterized protein LOC105021534 [Esox lucius]|uniref:Uncharacterized protein n=1 Tax=Esox lucius TaxID=8010 RepID=A0AAY5L072_ESOLU|nr:uncharacterized protein LOC105021534 [Esox lucius]
MAIIETFNEMGQLTSSGFGIPRPRHGLHLLYWFSHDFITFDNNGNLVALHKPESQAFGFHQFKNRTEFGENRYKLLPNQNFPYYGVGNLNIQGAETLPNYVKQNYCRYSDKSNMDRIIISLPSGSVVDEVYVTQHDDMKTFDREKTYRISKGLVKMIRDMKLAELLQQTGYLDSMQVTLRTTVNSSERSNRVAAASLQPEPVTEHVIHMPDESTALSDLSDSRPKRGISNHPRPARKCCVIL